MCKMDMLFELLLYLDGRRYLNSMRYICEEFVDKLNENTIYKFPPLQFLLEIDFMDLIDFMPTLGNYLIKEPLKWQYMCNDIFYACLKSLDSKVVQNVKPSQLRVILRLKSLPYYLYNMQIGSSLICVSGLLINISQPHNYVYHTVWSCPEECEENEVIFHYIPKTPPKCYMCKSVLYENSAFRYCGDEVKATFKILDFLLCKSFYIVDDLIPLLSLGRKYRLTAVVIKTSIYVWALEEENCVQAPITNPIPSDIKELFDSCDGLPWKFIYCLSSTLGIHCSPLNCFMHVKMNLVLSLTSVKANILTGSTILHFLAAGYDTGYVGKIMTQAARLSDRHILLGNYHSSASTTLIASSGGVCAMVLPFNVYKQKLTHDIMTSIETGVISSTGTKIQCAVWAQVMDFKKIGVYNITTIFGYVTRGDYGDYADELGDFVLEQALEPAKICHEEVQALTDLATYINLVAGLEVRLDKTSEALLKNYFLAARKERPKAVMIGSMNALVSICMTSAKLCRRSVTNIEDAVFAVWLHVSGIPEPRFAPGEYLETPSDVRKLQVIMSNFKGWLEQFTGTQIK